MAQGVRQSLDGCEQVAMIGVPVWRGRDHERRVHVVLATPDVLVLEALEPRRDEPDFWAALAVMMAGVHATRSSRFGWEPQP